MRELTRLKLICALQLIIMAQAAFGPFYAHDAGLTVSQVFMLYAYGMGVMWIGSLFLGQLVDRLGYRRSLIIGNIAYMVLLIAYANVHDIHQIVVVHGALTLTTTFLTPAPYAWLSQVAGKDFNVQASSAQMMYAFAAGTMQLAGGSLASWLGNRPAIALSAIVPVVCLLLAHGGRDVATTHDRPSLWASLQAIHRGRRSPLKLVLLYAVLFALANAPTGSSSILLNRAGYAAWVIGVMLIIELIGRFIPSVLFARITRLQTLRMRGIVMVYGSLLIVGYGGLFSNHVIGVPIGILGITACVTWARLCMQPLILGHPAVQNIKAMALSAVTFYSLPIAIGVLALLSVVV